VTRLAFNPLTNIVLNLVLLPTLGTIGAAIGRVGGVSASATLRHLLIARELTAVNWFRFAVKPGLISIAVGSVCYSLLEVGRPAWLLVFYVLVTLVLLRISSCFSPSAVKEMMSSPSGQD
jgi:O-antigen/teichoic acid export membrane protein